MMRRGLEIATTLALVLVLALGTVAMAKAPVLRMATTTSTDNTGLLDYLAPFFQKDTGIELQWVAVGTGKALQYGKNGDVDVLLVHDPEAEAVFMKEKNGKDRREVMYNDFILVGPASDPAKVKGKTVTEALGAIAAKKAPFASRGDKSGTHMAELRLWKDAGVATPDKESWYMSVGQGMIETLNVAGERNGYSLTDRGTYIKVESNYNGEPPSRDRRGGRQEALQPVQRHRGGSQPCPGTGDGPGGALFGLDGLPQGAEAHRRVQGDGASAVLPQRKALKIRRGDRPVADPPFFVFLQ